MIAHTEDLVMNDNDTVLVTDSPPRTAVGNKSMSQELFSISITFSLAVIDKKSRTKTHYSICVILLIKRNVQITT